MSTSLKRPAMVVALGVSAWLALWGDKTPVGGDAVVAPLASVASDTEVVPEQATLRPLSWTARDAGAAQAWAQSAANPFQPLDAPVAEETLVESEAVSGNVTPVLQLIGRGQTPDGRQTVFVLVADEVHSLHVGSRIAGLQVLSIEPQRLQLRQLKSRQTLSMPLSAPYGVFDQEKSPRHE